MYGGSLKIPLICFCPSSKLPMCCFCCLDRPWSSTFGIHKSGRWFHHGAWEVNLIQDEPGCLACFAVFLGHITYNSSKTLENESFKDVFPIEDGDLPLICWFTRGYHRFVWGERALCRNKLTHWRECLGVPEDFYGSSKSSGWRASHERCWTNLSQAFQVRWCNCIPSTCLFVFFWLVDFLVSEMKELLETSLNTSCFSIYISRRHVFFFLGGNPFESGISVSSFPGSLLSLSCTDFGKITLNLRRCIPTKKLVQWNFPDFCHFNPW